MRIDNYIKYTKNSELDAVEALVKSKENCDHKEIVSKGSKHCDATLETNYCLDCGAVLYSK